MTATEEIQMKQLEDEVFNLRLRVKDLQHQLYGAKSEKRPESEDPRQKTFESIDQSEPRWEQPVEPSNNGKRPKTKRYSGKKKGPKAFPAHLKRVPVSVPDPDLKDLICPISGKLMKKGFTQQIEVLSRIPAQYYVSVYTRNVFVSPEGVAPVYSFWPSHVLSKSRIDVSIIADVLTARFADHQPYYRISKQLERVGVSLSESTMGSLVGQSHEKVKLLYEAIKNGTLGSGYVQLDPTPIDLIDPARPGRAREGCMWTYRALDGPLFYDFATTKKGERVDQILKDYTGILQTDGANNFGQVSKSEQIMRLGCWVHARRYFYKAEQGEETAASVYLDLIDKLLRIERRGRHFGLSDKNFALLREHQSKRVLEKLFAMAADYCREHPMLRKTRMAKAIGYLLSQAKPLRACFDHVPSRIENNLVENAIRPLKLGAKNWLFIGSPQAGPRAAVMFTLIENCRMAGINPQEYLTDLLGRIDDHPLSRIDELIPQNWARSQKK